MHGEGFAGFYRRWWRVARDAAFEVLRSSADAEDAAQSVFLRLLRDDAWRSVKSPAQYIRTAGRRQALTLLWQSRARLRTVPLDGRHAQVLAGRASAGDRVVRLEEADRLRRLISHLPPRCQLVCSMIFLEGYSQAEVSERIGISRKAVEKQVARGRQCMRELLLRHEEIERPLFRTGGGV